MALKDVVVVYTQEDYLSALAKVEELNKDQIKKTLSEKLSDPENEELANVLLDGSFGITEIIRESLTKPGAAFPDPSTYSLSHMDLHEDEIEFLLLADIISVSLAAAHADGIITDAELKTANENICLAQFSLTDEYPQSVAFDLSREVDNFKEAMVESLTNALLNSGMDDTDDSN